MAEYTVNVAATSNGTANTDDVFIELDAAASTTCLVKRVRVASHATTPADNEIQIRVTRNSAAASFTSGTSFTPLKRRQNSPAATTASTVKNAANNATVGALTDTVLRSAVNQRGVWEWIARDKDDYIEMAAGAYIEVVIQCSAVSQLISVELDFEE